MLGDDEIDALESDSNTGVYTDDFTDDENIYRDAEDEEEAIGLDKNPNKRSKR
jgi:hypothetical protein